MESLADLLRAYGNADDDLIALAERWDASSLPEPDADNPDALLERVYADGVERLTDEELVSLREGLGVLAEADDVGVGLMNAAADVAGEIRDEEAVRDGIAEAEEAELEAARARLRGEDPEAEAAETEDGEEAESDDAEAADETDATADAGDGEDAETREPEPAMASAARRSSLQSLARRSGGSRRNTPPPAATSASGNRITFAAGLDGITAGAETHDLARVDAAIGERLEAFAGSNVMGGRENVRVARIHGNFPEDRRLVDDRGRFIGATEATDRIAAVLAAGINANAGRQAAGGFCAPPVPIFDVNIMGTTSRPIRDQSLTSFQQSRGRVLSLVPPRLQAVIPSTGIWTAEMDEEAVDDPDVRKTFLRVECGPEENSEVQAITSGLIYGELMNRTYGEWTQAWAQLARIAHAQLAEQELFDQLVAKATVVLQPAVELSATRDFVNFIAKLAWHVRLRNRELRTFPMRLTTSTTVLDIVAEDIAVSAFGGTNLENLTQAESLLTGALAARNINVTWSPDIEVPAAQTEAAAIVEYPDSVPYHLAPEGWAIHLDQGTLDVGVIRDKALVDANDVATFMESFEGVHMLGARGDARTGRVALCPSGGVYGFADPEGVCAGIS